MENAGRGLATLAARRAGPVKGRRVLCLAGKGGNGGGGLAACRYLLNWGAAVEALAVEPVAGSAAHVQTLALRKAGVSIRGPADLSGVHVKDFDIVLDAVLGYHIRGDPTGPAREMIEVANEARRVIALDLPSGLDPDTGRPGTPCVWADATLTLALPKAGILKAAAAPYVGDLWLGDLGIPAAVYARIGIRVPALFRPGQIMRRL